MKSQDNAARVQINARSCLFSETDDIKGPTRNIVGFPPEGGGRDDLGL